MMRGCKNYKNYFFKILAAALLLISFPTLTFAQIDTPGDGCDPVDGCDVPLDTWVIVLFAAAIVYGVYRLNKNQKVLKAGI